MRMLIGICSSNVKKAVEPEDTKQHSVLTEYLWQIVPNKTSETSTKYNLQSLQTNNEVLIILRARLPGISSAITTTQSYLILYTLPANKTKCGL